MQGIEVLMSIDDVVDVLRISESGVYRLVRNGELPRVKVGGRTLFDPNDVRALIANKRQGAGDHEGGRVFSSPPLEEG